MSATARTTEAAAEGLDGVSGKTRAEVAVTNPAGLRLVYDQGIARVWNRG